MSVRIRFLPDDVTVEAKVGEALLDVADRAGVFIPPVVLWVLVMPAPWNLRMEISSALALHLYHQNRKN